MDDIIISNEQSEEIAVNIGDLRQRFNRLQDRRGRQRRIYPLSYLLTVLCLAELRGEHTPTGSSEWIRLRYQVLREALAAHWLEAVARDWNRAPTPFEWGGKRAARREAAASDAMLSAALVPVPVAQAGIR